MDSADPLSELADIHLPAEVGFWPPAPGWWVLLALLLAGVLWLAFILVRRWRRQRYYQFALAELDKCYQRHEKAGAQDSSHDLDLINNVNAVLRRVALKHFPQEPVAGLTGLAWVEFIRAHGDAAQLDDELAGVLAHGRFAPACRVDPDKLHAMAQQWIKSLYLDSKSNRKLARIDNRPPSNAAPEHA